MTTPTPAQIEAARDVLHNHDVILHERRSLDGRIPDNIIAAALTAAAKIGEPTPERIRTEREITFHQTIERCAQVAEDFNHHRECGKEIGRRIRALKDK